MADAPLYELSKNLLGLEKLAEEGELDHDTINDTFEAIEGEFNDKALGLVTVSNRFNDSLEILDQEIKRLTARKKTMQNKKDGMIEYLRINMEATGIKKIECPVFTITLAAGRDVIVVDDAEAVDEDYVDIEMVTKVDKKALLAAHKKLEEGETMTGCHMEKSKSSVRIK